MPPSEPAEPTPYLSIVVTVRNEEAHLASLLDSLLAQPGPFEIVLVDAESTDATGEIAERYRSAHPDRLKIFRQRGHRGAGRNFGVQRARGDLIAFIDGDCIADPQWAQHMRESLASWEVVAGQTRSVGSSRFGELERVELYQGGVDVTFPSCNLGYRRSRFIELGGFDDRFITAEDIDLNLRAVRAGARIHYDPQMLVFHQTRATLARFLLQAFWNGYGRKQLTEKHGQLWAQYRYRRMLSSQSSPLAYARLAAALAGYFTRHLTALGPRQRIPTEGRESSANGKAQRA